MKLLDHFENMHMRRLQSPLEPEAREKSASTTEQTLSPNFFKQTPCQKKLTQYLKPDVRMPRLKHFAVHRFGFLGFAFGPESHPRNPAATV